MSAAFVSGVGPSKSETERIVARIRCDTVIEFPRTSADTQCHHGDQVVERSGSRATRSD